MPFDQQDRIAMFEPSMLAAMPALLAQHGHPLLVTPRNPHSETVVTLLGHLDRQGSDDLRAANWTPTMLTNGKIALSGHWSTSLIAAWEQGDIEAEEITAAQLEALRPEEEE
jgi:hypothetical protein